MQAIEYDVVVIGGGPAGMMAAGRAAQCGARVLLLEKNASLGAKLLITGGRRSNVTNAEFDQNIFLGRFKDATKFLFSPLSQFGVQDTLDFFHAHGMPTKIEAEKRVFPVSDSAQSVLDMLVSYMQRGSVVVKYGTEVAGLDRDSGKISGVQLKNRNVLRGHSYILATGGRSHPETGSTGDGFKWLKKIEHTVIESQAVLVPIAIRERWVHALSGVSLKDVKLTVFQNGKKQESRRGKILFTHFGLSGPLVLNMSKNIGELLQYGEVTVSLDLVPQMDLGTLDRKIQEVFDKNKNKKMKNILGEIVLPAFTSALLQPAQIDRGKAVNAVSREERLLLGRTMKDLRMTVSGLLGEEKAIITSGGVVPEEVDFKNMRSRLYPNLYLVGDILNIDRPSGGYSLQLCWTTGFVAGTSAAEK